jgi:hypothetical protein
MRSNAQLVAELVFSFVHQTKVLLYGIQEIQMTGMLDD